MATATKTTTRQVEATEQEFKRCACGCSLIVNPKRHFAPGHDQRYKGVLLRRFDRGDESAAVELMERGWRSNDELEARAEKREAKEQAKADRAAKREAGKAEREEAKAEKAAKPKSKSAETAAPGRRLAKESQVAESVVATT
jgi:ribose 1,5-bisphosphokinase PhnN